MRRNKLSLVQWKPQPINPPLVNAHLSQLDALSRSAECLRYFILSFEFWLSPSGDVREWFKINCRLCVWLMIPALLVMPVIGLILWQFTGWLSMLTAIAGKLILILLALLVFRIVISKR
jgi:hypothetical protein